MISLPYSKSFRPPAPVVSVAVGIPNQTHPRVMIDAQIDTGADRTVIPTSVAIQLGLIPGSQLQFGVVGGIVTLPVYFVAISIPGVMDFTIDVAGDDDEPLILLGRDVLNCLDTDLNGPDRILELSSQPPQPTTTP